jgi:RepB DNA-primase from phage plasmid
MSESILANDRRPQPLTIDTSQTRKFLELIGAYNEPCIFQTLPDDKKRNDRTLNHTFHGLLEEVGPRLASLNRRGAGVIMAINRMREGRRTIENVTAVRALFVDLDGAPIKPVLDCEIPPHVVVESSPGKYHAYWRTADVPLDQFSVLQRKLASLFNGDRAVCDLPRIMRLPGFWHQKSDPFQTRIIRGIA